MKKEPNAQSSKQIEAMIAKQKISGQWPVISLLNYISHLSDYDETIEAKKKFWQTAMIITLILQFLSIFASALLEMIYPFLGVIPLPIISVFFFLRYRKKDLPDDFRKFVGPLVHELRNDLKKGSPVSIDMALSSVEDKKNKTGESDKYEKGVYYKCIDHFFERDFLNLMLRLYDGNKLVIKAREFLIKIVKTKKNPRGKIKTKTKYKRKVFFNIRLMVNGNRYLLKEIPEGIDLPDKQKIYTKESSKGSILGLRYTEKLTEDDISDPWNALGKIAVLYALLEPKKMTQPL